jgi:hypothetical protein
MKLKALQYYCKFSLFILLTIGFFSSSAQTTPAFHSGEILRYKGSFIISGLWTDIAELKMEVADFETKGKSLYSLKASANTYTSYDSFFKIRDLYQSWVNRENLKPYMFIRQVDEGGYKFNIKYIFKRAGLKAKYDYSRNGVTKSQIISFSPETYDIMSALYHVRNIDMSILKTHQIIKLTVIIDGKLNQVNLKYLGKENLKVESLGNTNCYKFGLSTDNASLESNESSFVWFSADNKRIPVLIEAEIPVGKIQVRLIEVK